MQTLNLTITYSPFLSPSERFLIRELDDCTLLIRATHEQFVRDEIKKYQEEITYQPVLVTRSIA